MKKEEKIFRKFIKKFYRCRPALPICSLMESERCHCDPNEKYISSFTEYGFLTELKHPETMTDEEIQEYVDENIVMQIRSPYDCTGQQFTMWFQWHRNPCGLISYQHQIGIDV